MSADRLPQVPAAQFVEKWQKFGPVYFTELGYSGPAVSARASKLRKAGVPLKKWPTAPRSRGGLDLEALKQIAEKALSDSAESLDDTSTDTDTTDGDVSDV